MQNYRPTKKTILLFPLLLFFLASISVTFSLPPVPFSSSIFTSIFSPSHSCSNNTCRITVPPHTLFFFVFFPLPPFPSFFLLPFPSFSLSIHSHFPHPFPRPFSAQLTYAVITHARITAPLRKLIILATVDGHKTVSFALPRVSCIIHISHYPRREEYIG